MAISLQTATRAFQRGLSMGIQGIFRGELVVDPCEEGMIEIVQNLIELAEEGNLDKEILRQDVGIIVGFAATHPTLFIRQS